MIVRPRHSGCLCGALLALVSLAAGAGAAAAQSGPAAIVELRGGVELEPRFLGAAEYDLSPDAGLRFNYVRLPGGLAFGEVDDLGLPRGFGVQGAFRYIGTRRPSDSASLAGTDRVERSLELGFGVNYEARDWRAFGVVRYGVVGHNAWVADAGADALFRPREDVVLNLGPRARWGSDRFMQTYFGVSGEDAANSPLDEFNASSGLYAVGMEVGARYQFSERWGVESSAFYDRLVDDAAASPITDAGSRDQFGVRLGLIRTIRLGF